MQVAYPQSGFGHVKACRDSVFMASPPQFAPAVSSADEVPLQNLDEGSKEITQTEQPVALQERVLEGPAAAQSCFSPRSLNGEEGADEIPEDPHDRHETGHLVLHSNESPKHEGALAIDGWNAPSLCEKQTSSIPGDVSPASSIFEIAQSTPGEPRDVLGIAFAERDAIQEEGSTEKSGMAVTGTAQSLSTDVAAVLEETSVFNIHSHQIENKATDAVAQEPKENDRMELAVAQDLASTDCSAAFEESIINTVNSSETGGKVADIVGQGSHGNSGVKAIVMEEHASTDLSAAANKNIVSNTDLLQETAKTTKAIESTSKVAVDVPPILVLQTADLQDFAGLRENDCVGTIVTKEPTSADFPATVEESITNNTDAMQSGDESTQVVDTKLNRAAEDASTLFLHNTDLQDQAGVAAPLSKPINAAESSLLAKEREPCGVSASTIDIFETASIRELQNMLMDSSSKHPEVASSLDRLTVQKVEDGYQIPIIQEEHGRHPHGMDAVAQVEMKVESHLSSPDEKSLNSVTGRGPDEDFLANMQTMSSCVAVVACQKTENNGEVDVMECKNVASDKVLEFVHPQNFNSASNSLAKNGFDELQASQITEIPRETQLEEANIGLHTLSTEVENATNEGMDIDKDIQGTAVFSEGVSKRDAEGDPEIMPADEIIYGPPQIRKRGRKPGRKSTKHVEKDAGGGLLQEYEPENETSDSPLKHTMEVEHKRELRKRGRKPGTSKVVQKEEEDVCFVCFDGGKLILCDKRSCPKAYHVECTGRESEFFEKKGQWFCGWHVCSQCSKSANLNCYMCPTALCSNCVKGANFLFIQKGRGLCENCYSLVHLIEYNESIKGDPVQVDFNDKETYEGLFKEYWEEVKIKNAFSSAEFKKACKAREAGGAYWEGEANNGENVMSIDAEEIVEDENDGSTDSEDQPPTMRHARLMKRKRLTRQSVAEDASATDFDEEESDDDVRLQITPKKGRTRALEFDGWASKELVDLIRSLKEDPKKPLPLFGVKKLLWRYIDDNKLTNPRRRGQILCDERLRKLFGKKLVGRFEMMKLISLHVASPNKSMASKSGELQYNDDSAEIEDIEENQAGKKKFRKKGDDRRFKPDPSEYAAINVKNINLIYLKRSVLDELRSDPELESKAIGAFVRIRVPGSANKTDACYRLVQIIGVKQIYDAHDPEKVTDVILEIQNLHKREEVTADLVSNQELVEEECQRLRQSVRCGLIQPMRVGELEERARALREAKVKDWREFELLRLSHLRDRASEKGRKKELRECVEKLQLLSTQEEKERLLNAPFDIDADPFMDPAYESEEDDSPADDGPAEMTQMSTLQNTQEKFFPNRFSERSNNPLNAENPFNHRDTSNSLESHKGLHNTQQRPFSWGLKDSLNSASGRQTADLQAQGWNSLSDTPSDKSTSGQSKGRWGDARGQDHVGGWNHGNFGRKEMRWNSNSGGNVQSFGGGSWSSENMDNTSRFAGNLPDSGVDRGPGQVFSPIQAAGSMSAIAPFASVAKTGTMAIDNEKEKIWCYLDPTRTVQGPFTMEQLRKWEKTNLFPSDLRIWKANESQDAAVLLSDALAGRFTSRGFLDASQKVSFPPSSSQSNHVSGIPVQGLNANNFSVGQNGGTVTSSSAQGVITNPMPPSQRPVIQGFPSSAQGANAHNFTPGPMQGPTPRGFPSAAPLHASNTHGFPTVPTGPSQATNVHTFGPAPTQGPYANNFPAASLQGTPTQGPNVTGYPPNIPQGVNVGPGRVQSPSIVQNRPQGPNVMHGQMQGPNVHPVQAQMPNVSQGSHFGNVQMSHSRGSHANHFQMGANPGAVHNNAPQIRHSNEWQDIDRRSGPDHRFGVPSNMRGAANDGGARGIPTRSPWRQGPGSSHQDHRDPPNRGQFARSQNYRGSDQFHGNDSRSLPRKDLFCKYFSRGLCRKGHACDFRHE